MGFDNGIHYNPTIIPIHGITGNFPVQFLVLSLLFRSVVRVLFSGVVITSSSSCSSRCAVVSLGVYLVLSILGVLFSGVRCCSWCTVFVRNLLLPCWSCFRPYNGQLLHV